MTGPGGGRTYDFDAVQDHRYDGSIRWQQPEGRSDVIGMGTADLDFVCAPCIKEALRPIWENNIYHYKWKPDAYFEAISRWFQVRYGLPVQKEWMSNILGTIAAVCIAVKKFSRRGDYILMQTPYFDPLRRTIEGAGRRFLENPLVLKGCRYEIDFEDFEEKIAAYHPAAFLLINPHNCGGERRRDGLAPGIDGISQGQSGLFHSRGAKAPSASEAAAAGSGVSSLDRLHRDEHTAGGLEPAVPGRGGDPSE